MTVAAGYPAALDWLFSRTRHGAGRSPARMAALLAELGLQPPPAVAHVVGTNGKGTVSAMLAAGLQAAGTRTGLFISPHVEEFRERITVNGRQVSEAEVTAFVQRIQPDADLRDAAFFEYTLALALQHFAAEHVGFVVLEAGVGARNDATLAVGNTVLTVMTSIALDHTQTLGESVELIAAEKAAAIVPGAPVVTAATGSVLEVIRAAAGQTGSELVVPATHRELFQVPPGSGAAGTRLLNQQLAAAGLRLLGVSEEAVRAGVSRPPLPARGERFRVLGTEVVLDGAHDPAAAAALVEDLPAGYVLVYGGLGRKQREATCSVLARNASMVISTAVEPEDPLEPASATVIRDNRAAIEAALEAAGPAGLVVIAGSLYLAGSMRPLLLQLAQS